METQARTELLKNRIIEHINNKTMDYSQELHIFEVLLTRYPIISLSEYARKENITFNGAKERLKNKKIMTVKNLIIEPQ